MMSLLEKWKFARLLLGVTVFLFLPREQFTLKILAHNGKSRSGAIFFGEKEKKYSHQIGQCEKR